VATEPPFRVSAGACAPLAAPWTLAGVLAPVSVAEFSSSYWGRRPLLVERGRPDFYRDLVSLEEMERYLSVDALLEEQDVRLRPRDFGPPQPVTALSTVYERVSRGKTLQLRKMERFMDPGAPLLALYRDMELAIQHPKSSLSCYLSPPGGQGLGPHHDETEIFTLQVTGRKRWKLYQAVSTDEARIYRREELGPPRHDFVAAPGDLFYHPRGHVHEVSNEGEEPAFSITIVFEPVDWKALLDLLKARLAKTPEFLEPLAAGVLLGGAASSLSSAFEERIEMIRGELARLTVEELVDTEAARHVARMSLPPGRHLSSLFSVDDVAPATAVALRREVRCHLARKGDEVHLTLPGGLVLPAPARFEAAMRFVLSAAEPFRVDAIEGALSSEEKLDLARELLRHGVLERPRADAG
jgi:hypothetical protein